MQDMSRLGPWLVDHSVVDCGGQAHGERPDRRLCVAFLTSSVGLVAEMIANCKSLLGSYTLPRSGLALVPSEHEEHQRKQQPKPWEDARKSRRAPVNALLQSASHGLLHDYSTRHPTRITDSPQSQTVSPTFHYRIKRCGSQHVGRQVRARAGLTLARESRTRTHMHRDRRASSASSCRIEGQLVRPMCYNLLNRRYTA